MNRQANARRPSARRNRSAGQSATRCGPRFAARGRRREKYSRRRAVGRLARNTPGRTHSRQSRSPLGRAARAPAAHSQGLRPRSPSPSACAQSGKSLHPPRRGEPRLLSTSRRNISSSSCWPVPLGPPNPSQPQAPGGPWPSPRHVDAACRRAVGDPPSVNSITRAKGGDALPSSISFGWRPRCARRRRGVVSRCPSFKNESNVIVTDHWA